MMNIYGKEASAYYDLFSGLRHLKRGETKARSDRRPRRTTRSARSSRSSRTASAPARSPETDGFWATRNLAVIKAGVQERARRPRRSTWPT